MCHASGRPIASLPRWQPPTPAQPTRQRLNGHLRGRDLVQAATTGRAALHTIDEVVATGFLIPTRRAPRRFAAGRSPITSSHGGVFTLASDVTPERRGKRWTQDEDDLLLALVRGPATLDEIAATLQRTVVGVCARVDVLIGEKRLFPRTDEAFAWARDEIRKGRRGDLAWAADRADRVPESKLVTASVPPAPPPRRRAPTHHWPAPVDDRKILSIWETITGISLTADQQQHFLARPELLVLGRSGEERIAAAATEMWEAEGRLTLRQWVLECDWPGVLDLALTSTEIRAADDTASLVGAELVSAGLRKIRFDREREIVAARLGLRGDVLTLGGIGEQHDITGERVRQVQNKGLFRLTQADTDDVKRSWHHTRDTLRTALGDGAHAELAPDLVHTFVQLALPTAPLELATTVIAHLCGHASHATLLDAVTEFERGMRERRKADLTQNNARARADARVARLAEAADWPKRPHSASPLLRDLRPQREPVGSGTVKSIVGRWASEKNGRTVGHESGVELRFMQLLDAAPMIASYCEQPVAVPYQVEGETHQYYPDLLVRFTDERNLLVEVKSSLHDFAVWPNPAKFAAATHFAHENGWGFVATASGARTLRDLVERPINRALEDHLRQALTLGTMNWRTVAEAMTRLDATHNDIAALIWHNGWCWQLRPYRLSTGLDEGTQ